MRYNLFTLMLAYLLSILNTNASNEDSLSQKILFNTNKFKYILETINQNYADSVDIDKLSEEAFGAMLKNLDIHSLYFDKSRLYNTQADNRGSEIGIGIDIRVIGDTCYVYNIIAKSPADSLGITAFDKILAIDDTSMIAKTADYIFKKIKGERNTTIKIRIENPFTKNVRDVNIVRRDVQISSIDIALILPGTKTGYIKLNKFSKISHDELIGELGKLKKAGMKNLIIDLRDDPGGFLEQVGMIIDEFIPDGDTIVYTKARNPIFKTQMISSGGGICENIALILLINKNSASASELFAGVVQDLDRGLVVGQRSFGKSSAQRLWTMTDSTGFQMTVAEYYTTLGRMLGKNKNTNVGIDPSVKLSLSDSTYDQINNIVKEFGAGAKLPVFYSKKGRALLGGAGVFPDYPVEEDSVTLLTQILIQRNVLTEFVYKFLKEHINSLEAEYKENTEMFISDFRVTDKMLIDLKAFSYTKNLWNEEMFQKDSQRIKTLIKAEISKVLFNNSAYFAVLIKDDKYVEKALELMHESENLIK